MCSKRDARQNLNELDAQSESESERTIVVVTMVTTSQGPDLLNANNDSVKEICDHFQGLIVHFDAKHHY